jgi:dipeptidyl aminopeptidase/acylaminoacyl peptidase
MLYRWSADGAHLYAIVGGNWDWQVWDIPVGSGSTVTLAASAAAISDLAPSPDGTQLAFTAAPELDYPNNRCRLYVLQLGDHSVRTIDIPDADLGQLTWVAADAIVVVATKADPDQRWSLPAPRTLKRVHLPDGGVEDVS